MVRNNRTVNCQRQSIVNRACCVYDYVGPMCVRVCVRMCMFVYVYICLGVCVCVLGVH